jgi:hypothetical protein
MTGEKDQSKSKQKSELEEGSGDNKLDETKKKDAVKAVVPPTDKPPSAELNVWKGGYAFALVLLFFTGVLLIALGVVSFPDGSFWNVFLVNTGVAMAPAAIVSQLFRVFLFEEVRYELTHPVLNEVRDRLGPEIHVEIDKMMAQYREEIGILRALNDAGVIHPYRSRESAIRDFATAIDEEQREIMVIGSSLKGLLKKDNYKLIAEKLKFKQKSAGVPVKFLLTHPMVADLRAGQEGRRSSDIGLEIIASLETLRDWGMPESNVRLYCGTPTCFAIKTEKKMLLNPYPYGGVAYDSPCLIVEFAEEKSSYFYRAFNTAHFGAWDTNFSVIIRDYDEKIAQLRKNLANYANAIAQIKENCEETAVN